MVCGLNFPWDCLSKNPNFQRIELKRLEHERQRTLQRKMFEEQMFMLEQQQLQEERELLSIPSVDSSHGHVALSAPTTHQW
jgi:hypothetical protein